jgi:hypothetical protein
MGKVRFEKLIVPQLVKKFTAFCGTRGIIITVVTIGATCPYPEADASTSHPPIMFIYDPY